MFTEEEKKLLTEHLYGHNEEIRDFEKVLKGLAVPEIPGEVDVVGYGCIFWDGYRLMLNDKPLIEHKNEARKAAHAYLPKLKERVMRHYE